MSSPCAKPSSLRLVCSLSLLFLLLLLTAPASARNTLDTPTRLGPSSERQFYGSDDTPLPFGEDQLLDFLATAEIVESKVISSGINRPRKLTLQKDGVEVHAVFRTVDRDGKGRSRPGPRNRHSFRDSYLYEVAAYRLSRVLGIHRVPPAVLRTIDGERGSVQLWIENARTAADAIKGGIATEAPARRYLQRQLMYGFDQLIFNFDRHHGNILYDERNRLWFIDHTRSFRVLPQLPREDRPILADRTFHGALQALDPKTVKQLLDEVLTSIEVDALLKRRKMLLRYYDELIDERGADKVLVDVDQVVRPLDPPSAQASEVAAQQTEVKIIARGREEQ